MAFACNMDRKGRIYRAMSGALFLGLAICSYLYAYPSESGVARFFQGFFGLLGLFQLFESAMGWCVLRALGVKTPV